MKKIIVILGCVVFAMATSFAQKFAFVDTEYILKNIPSYKAAQEKIDKLSEGWQKEVEDLYKDVEKMDKDYQAEKVLLSDQLRQKREDEILNKEKEARDLQKKYFGPSGDLFNKRQELVKPIQDEVYKAIKELAVEGNYTAIFDSSSDANLLYSDPKSDKSDAVLQKLGYKN
jgi:outer membrane protein